MKTDLLSMGYRCLGTNAAGVTVWAKPFGCTLLVIAVAGTDLTLAQHFKGNDGQSLVWSTQKYDQAQDGTLLQWIQYTETFHVRTGIGYGDPNAGNYAFLTVEQKMEALLNK
jgi:hypothetical protein